MTVLCGSSPVSYAGRTVIRYFANEQSKIKGVLFMAFSTIVFLFAFLPVALGGYYLLCTKFRTLSNLFLICISLAFFAYANTRHVLPLLIFIAGNHLIGKGIQHAGACKRKSRLFLIVGILLNAGILVYYKYTNFFLSNVNAALGTQFSTLKIVVPLGISFLIFQAVSFLVDIYRQEAKIDSLIDTALYLTFFPKLISGPLVRYCDFQPQIANRTHSTRLFSEGIERLIIGLAKKVILADTFGVLVDTIFGSLKVGIDIPTAWLGAFCYMLQIYFDFSGYSDCAIGLAKFFGFDFKENFDFPYTSCSITEFWRRWHISLGTWFRQYIYFPLGGSRTGNVYFHLFVVFLFTGLWHGSSWNFIAWGLVNAFFVLLERALWNTKFYTRIPRFVKWTATFVIVFFSWILFRSSGFMDAVQYLRHMFGLGESLPVVYSFSYYLNAKIGLFLLIGFFGSTYAGRQFYEKFWKTSTNTVPALYIGKTVVLAILFVLSVMFIINSQYAPFLYFQF